MKKAILLSIFVALLAATLLLKTEIRVNDEVKIDLSLSRGVRQTAKYADVSMNQEEKLSNYFELMSSEEGQAKWREQHGFND